MPIGVFISQSSRDKPTADANESPQIRNELVQAVNRSIPIIPPPEKHLGTLMAMGRIAGDTLIFTHAATNTKFVAQFDINADHVIVETTLKSGMSVQTVLNSFWRSVKRK